ncbi:MAG TPA: DNA/RNA non-specific endonuclease [Allosphingosinicella sp.]|jgi:DNA/RNA endonuclease G (NUC1)
MRKLMLFAEGASDRLGMGARRFVVLLLAPVLCLAPSAPALAAPRAHHGAALAVHAKEKPCSKAEAKAADKVLLALDHDPAALSAAAARHLPWGAPDAGPNERRLVQPDYVVDYDSALKVPIWTSEQIVASNLNDKIKRQDCFRADPRLDADASSNPADYKEPIYDQGHMTPFADQRYSKVAGMNSFVMTNMAPQNCQLNRGIWQILEQISRRWAAAHEPLYIFNGSVFDRDGDGTRDPDAAAMRMQSANHQARVAVPSAFYKIAAYVRPDGGVETVTVLLPHDTANPAGSAALDYLNAHVTGLATVQKLTGLRIFPQATNLHESKTLWAFEGYKPQSLCHAKAPAPTGHR